MIARSYSNTSKLFDNPVFHSRLMIFAAFIAVGIILPSANLSLLVIASFGGLAAVALAANFPLWPFALAAGMVADGRALYAISLATVFATILRYSKKPKVSPGEERLFRLQHPELKSSTSLGFAWQLTLCCIDKPRGALEALARVPNLASHEGALGFFLATFVTNIFFFVLGKAVNESYNLKYRALTIAIWFAVLGALVTAPLVLRSLCRLKIFAK